MDDDGYLTGRLLIAMPGMADPRFAKAVVYMCAHSPAGAMGIVVNRRLDSITLPELMLQLGIPITDRKPDWPVHFGGPVESGRGFVLHSPEFRRDETLLVAGSLALTATIDILHAIAGGEGPARSLFALGYAGWGPGQLDEEIQANGWLTGPADPSLVFDGDDASKWHRAMAGIGVHPSMLSHEAGRA